MKPHSKFLAGAVAALVATATLATPLGYSLSHPAPAGAASAAIRLNCAVNGSLCAEVYDSERVFGQGVYVGHDEPSTLFYSNQPGSGNRMAYYLRLPTDPPVAPPRGHR